MTAYAQPPAGRYGSGSFCRCAACGGCGARCFTTGAGAAVAFGRAGSARPRAQPPALLPSFVTRGDRDLVVPTRALAPALRAVLGAARVDDSSPSRLGVTYPDGQRFVDVFDYPAAGHMISMLARDPLARDVEGRLARLSSNDRP